MECLEVSATSVRFDPDLFWVDLSDGRVLGVPLAWFPRLLHATTEQLATVRISPRGLHWEELDEDVSIEGLLRGLGDQTRGRNVVHEVNAGALGVGDSL